MKHFKITSVLLSVVMCMSFILTPVTAVADETQAPEETTEATEAPETSKETEAAKETEKLDETEKETEPSEPAETEPEEETVPETTKETEAPEETVPEETGETAPSESEPAETGREEPEETVPSEPGIKDTEASRKRSDAVTTGSLGGNVTYSFDDKNGTLTISGTGFMLSFLGDSPFASFKEKVKKVVVEDGVTNIGSYLFYGLNKITSVSIADSVTTIDGWAFQGCTGLTEIRLPSKLGLINNGAFSGCTGIKSITVPGKTYNILPDAFEGSGLTTVTLKEGVTNIDKWFKGCTGITTVNLPKSVKSIKNTFDGSKSISHVYYAGSTDDWKKIDFGDGDNPFFNAFITYNKVLHNITVKPVEHGKVTLSQYEGYHEEKITITVTPDAGYYYAGYLYGTNSGYNLGDYFYMADKDMELEFVFKEIKGSFNGYHFDVFPLKYKITNNAINGTGTVMCVCFVNFLSNTEEGYYQAFGKLIIPSAVRFEGVTYKVTAVDSNAFKGNKYIQTITIGSNVAVIGNNAFYGCAGLTKVSGGARLKTIGANAFARCPKLSSFTITSKVLNKIGTYAFAKDSKLKTISIKNTTKLLKKGVKKSLKSSKIKTVKVKKSKVRKYRKYFTKKNCGRRVKVKK